MTDRYKEYEQACERIRQQNESLLSDFGDWLAGKGLSEKTVRSHVQNIDLYVNHFLLYEEAIEAVHGAYRVSMFLGYWFIRKVLWASESAIRSNAASLKKFYSFLNEKSLVSDEEVGLLREAIKEELPDWLGTMRRYENPLITDPATIWGLREYP